MHNIITTKIMIPTILNVLPLLELEEEEVAAQFPIWHSLFVQQ